MKRMLSTLLLLLVISACGQDEDNLIPDGITGVWDNTIEYYDDETGSFIEDEGYIAIRSDGTYTVYNYAGDPFDQGDDCYYSWDLSLSVLGDNLFLISRDDEALETLGLGNNQEGHLVISYDDNTHSFERSELEISDLSPECEDEFHPIYPYFLNHRWIVSINESDDPSVVEDNTLGTLYQDSTESSELTGNVYIYAH